MVVSGPPMMRSATGRGRPRLGLCTALFHVYGNGWTMKELYGIWCEMPLMIQRSRRGQGETAKEHQANLQKTKDEVQQFLDANNLGRPQSPAEWRQCYRELGKFLAMRAFLTNTPQVVMEIPVAPITDDREHMIMRAICDERISLPFKEHPEIYDQIGGYPPGGPAHGREGGLAMQYHAVLAC